MQLQMSTRARLSMLLAGASWLLILLWILRPGSSGLPEVPLLRIVLALMLAALNTWVAIPGAPRRALAGWFFGTVLCNIVVQYGEMIGLRPTWQRWLLGLLISSPFIYLIFTPSKPPRGGDQPTA